jgi:hypothetical protein
MANKKTWIVTTSGDRSIQDIGKELADAGLTDIKILTEVGIITGSADETIKKQLHKVRGVKDISPDISIDIGPPNSRETW